MTSQGSPGLQPSCGQKWVTNVVSVHGGGRRQLQNGYCWNIYWTVLHDTEARDELLGSNNLLWINSCSQHWFARRLMTSPHAESTRRLWSADTGLHRSDTLERRASRHWESITTVWVSQTRFKWGLKLETLWDRLQVGHALSQQTKPTNSNKPHHECPWVRFFSSQEIRNLFSVIATGKLFRFNFESEVPMFSRPGSTEDNFLAQQYASPFCSTNSAAVSTWTDSMFLLFCHLSSALLWSRVQVAFHSDSPKNMNTRTLQNQNNHRWIKKQILLKKTCFYSSCRVIQHHFIKKKKKKKKKP